MPIYTSTSKNQKKPPRERKPKATNTSRVKVNPWVIVLTVSSILLFLIIFPFINIFRDFFVGAFGLFIYPALVCLCVVSGALISKKNYHFNGKYIFYLALTLFFVLEILHLALTAKIPLNSYGQYLAAIYNGAASAGGVLMSLLTYPIVKALTIPGAYVFYIIMTSVSISLTIEYVVRKRLEPRKTDIQDTSFVPLTDLDKENVPVTLNSLVEHNAAEVARAKLGLKNKNEKVISSNLPSYIDTIKEHPMTRQEYILTPTPIVMPPKDEDIFIKSGDTKTYKSDFGTIKTKYEKPIAEKETTNYDYTQYTIQRDTAPRRPNDIYQTPKNVAQNNVTKIENDAYLPTNKPEIKEVPVVFAEEKVAEHLAIPTEREEKVDYSAIKPSTVYTEEPIKADYSAIKPSTVYAEEPIKVAQSNAPYVKPPLSLLKFLDVVEEDNSERVQSNIEVLEKTLEEFKVPAKVIAVQKGPAVTRYELSMPGGISVKKVQLHADDIAMVLASNGAVRIEAPIPGKNAVGIEVPNDHVTPISLREILDNNEFAVRPSPLSMALGKDINGDIKFCNLDKLVHVIVAGSTGSGKSVCLNAMILSMIYKAGPADLRLILIDPKRVEFSIYEGLPHLLLPHVVTEKDQAINALNWAIKEMERRYMLLQRYHVVNIKEYNNLATVKNGQIEKLPFIVIVMDELADFMVDARREMEERLMKLAQKARAAGIHLVVATQRPSVDVITGTIKANFTSRIAFALTNYADSKTIIDGSGAEKLLGKGDMLFKPNDIPEPIRVQGAFVSSEEVAAVVDFVKKNNPSVFDINIEKEILVKKDDYANGGNMSDAIDPLLKPVLRMFLESGTNSITMIQRRFGVGFMRAGRIMDQLEFNKFMGPQEGTKPRPILINLEDFHNIFPDD